jgi:O-antigen/teichoic acid export membrane protein
VDRVRGTGGVKSLATVSTNIAANFAGRAWVMLMGFAFVPVYLHLLGIEAYGVIGFFLTLQSVLGIMDFGLSLTLNRELARSWPDGGSRMANLLRTMEIAYWVMSVVVGLLVIEVAPWIAKNWVHTVTLSSDAVESAIRMMGVVISLQAPFALYQGGLAGLQRQVSVNLILAVAATLRAAGAALVLWLLSTTVEAYFVWQIMVSALATGLCAWALWRLIPDGSKHARFDLSLLRGLWRFALTVAANAIVGISLTQLDKLILSKLLALDQFGYYMLAALVASSLWAIILPINTALFPRFVQLHEQSDEAGLAALYHKACQFMAAALLPAAMILMLFPQELLLVWTRDEVIARNAALLVTLLTFGTAVNGVISVATYLQSAAGWPGLILYTNAALAVVLIPTLLVAVPRFGPVGAAAVWVTINCTYFLVTLPIMHRKLLRGELARWYVADLILPAVAVTAIGVPMRLLMPVSWSPLAQFAFLFCAWVMAILGVVLVAPLIRRALASLVLSLLGKTATALRVGMSR